MIDCYIYGRGSTLAGWYRAQGDTVLLIDSWEDLLYHAKEYDHIFIAKADGR